MKRVIVTGAGGFVGRQLCEVLAKQTDWHLVLIDNVLSHLTLPAERVTLIENSLQGPGVLDEVFASPCDILFHLAAVPGGAAEQDPALSKAVNLDATLAMFERAAAQDNCPRIVFTSTIAVLGAPMPEVVDDASPIVPAMTYGAHKAMVELALADLSRRGLVDSVAVRLPGIIARPLAKNGLKSAFLSNVFHLLACKEPFISPVSEQATMWLMSVQQCALNLFHASQLDSALMPTNRVVTLPALRVGMTELVEEIAEQTGADLSLVSWQPDPGLEEGFGKQPPLFTPGAEKAGFERDKTLSVLVANGLLLTSA